MKPLILLAAAACLLLASCEKPVEPPGETGLCYHVVPLKDGKLRYNKLAEGVPNIETCAAKLEAMRLQVPAHGRQHPEHLRRLSGQLPVPGAGRA